MSRRVFLRMSRHGALHAFDQAMNRVYGNFDVLSEHEATKWVPPASPGAGGHRGRYLWTDAFGVVNFVTLYQEMQLPKYLTLAKRLVREVHEVLGKTRDARERLPGATDEKPLGGGLRIGKMAEFGSDGDGQYHHYLTLWMFALNRLSLAARAPEFNRLAIQLAQAIHQHFIFQRPSSGDLKMVWKVSIDLHHILVPSEGHLDAATGYVICRILQDTAGKQGDGDRLLDAEISDYFHIMHQKGAMKPSGDTLDLGMGLWISHFFDQEPWAVNFRREALKLAREMMDEQSLEMRRPATRRLAFRELGACLGVLCSCPDGDLQKEVAGLVQFWDDYIQKVDEVDDLRPISEVMYAAAVIPGGECSFSNRVVR